MYSFVIPSLYIRTQDDGRMYLGGLYEFPMEKVIITSFTHEYD